MTAPKVRVDPTISTGDIITVILIIVAIVSFAIRLQDNQAQNTKDISEAREASRDAFLSLKWVNQRNLEDFNLLKIDVAVVKNQVIEINKKLDFIDTRQASISAGFDMQNKKNNYSNDN